jgi:hypothetical protein
MMYTTIVHQKVAIEANISSVEKKCGWVILAAFFYVQYSQSVYNGYINQ